MVSATPEREAEFQRRKREHGSFFAFHGSKAENILNILRHGLMNASGTKFQLNGAALGSGIYLAENMGVSAGYTRSAEGWQHSIFGLQISCMFVCEAIYHDSFTRASNPGIYVLPDEKDVLTRYFLINPSNRANLPLAKGITFDRDTVIGIGSGDQ